MKSHSTHYVIDLTLDSDEDEVCEIPCPKIIHSTDFVKKELEESISFLDEISEIPRAVGREVEGEVGQGVEEDASTLTVERVTLQETPRVTLEEAAIPEGFAQAATAVEDRVTENIPTALVPPRPVAIPPLSLEELIARDHELEEQLRNGIESFFASLNGNAPALQSIPVPNMATPQTEEVVSEGEDVSWMRQVGVEAEAEDVEAAAKFTKIRKEYEKKRDRKETTTVDDIEFAKAEAAEQRRLKRMTKIESRLQHDQADVADSEDDELFFRETVTDTLPSGRRSASDDDNMEVPPAKKPKFARKNKLTAQELRESMAAGLEAGLAKEKKKSGRKPRKLTDKAPNKKSSPKASAAKKKNEVDKVSTNRGRSRKGHNLTNLNNLIRTNIIKDAQGNELKRDMPTFTSKDKSKALQELIKSIPTEERPIANSDKADILEATKKFNGRGSVRSDQKGGWLLKGMKSSLYGHQLLGAAFLRDRENGNAHPFGGMVCDEMGFGKTIMMLANLVRTVLSFYHALG